MGKQTKQLKALKKKLKLAETNEGESLHQLLHIKDYINKKYNDEYVETQLDCIGHDICILMERATAYIKVLEQDLDDILLEVFELQQDDYIDGDEEEDDDDC